MAKTIGSNRNVNDAATVTNGVALSTNLAVLAVAANTERISLTITVTTRDAWIRLIPAATDNAVRKGMLIESGHHYRMDTDNVYTGEISIINALNNAKPVFYVTEY